MTNGNESVSFFNAWKYYINFFKGYYKQAIASVFLSSLCAFTVLGVTYLISIAFDRAVASRNLTLLLKISGGILGLTVVNALLGLWTRHLTLLATKTALQRLRDSLLNACYGFSASYYNRTDRGKLHASLVQDTERVDGMSNLITTQVLPAAVTSLALCALLIYLHWILFLVLIATIPPLIYFSRPVRKKLKTATTFYHRAFESFSKGVLFVLQMIELTRIQTAEEREIEKQRELLKKAHLANISMSWLSTYYIQMQNMVSGIAAILILVLGGYFVIVGSMSIGKVFSFFVAIGLLRSYLNLISMTVPQIISGNEALKDLYIFAHQQDSLPYLGDKRISFNGGIVLKDVFFQYKDTPTLQNINLTIKPQSTVAIIGPNGSGKSTIVQLILGFYAPEKGQVLADGHPYDDLNIKELRKAIGVVPQNGMVFSETVFENITYGLKNVPRDDVIEAAKSAAAHDFIEKLPQGYDTPIGEQGFLLSGGERQRIAIARALLRKPRLLILDEPTNHLDERSVRHLISHLKTMQPHPTILLISHDHNIVKDVDALYALEDGKIVSQKLKENNSFPLKEQMIAQLS